MKKLSTFRFADPRELPGFDGEQPVLTLDAVKDLIKSSIPDVNTIVNGAIANLKKTDLPKIIKDELNPVTAQLTSISDTLTKLSAGGEGSGSGSGSGSGEGKNQNTPEVNAQIKTLQSSLEAANTGIKELKEAKEKAEKDAEQSDRHGKIQMALSGLQFANERAGHTAFQIVEPFVQRREDRSLVGVDQGGTQYPMETFFKDFITRDHPYLLKGTGAGGAGASSGTSGVGGQMTADMNMIKPGMSKGERDAVLAAISAAANR